MWQPDGWGFRARIGVLTPHADIGPESEFHAMSPAGVSIHTGRAFFGAMSRDTTLDHAIALEPVRAFSQPPHIDEAATLLAAAPVSVIAYAFTSSSYVSGPQDDKELAARLADRTGLPLVVTCHAAVEGLRGLGAEKLALVNPPWFSPELTEMGAAYFRHEGFEVVHSSSMEIPGGQLEVHPGEVYGWARTHVPAEADAVFIGGNGLRAIGVIQTLEEDLDKPVITANQVAFWRSLRTAGIRAPVTGYGRLFDLAPAP